jgi:DNA repair exonuclease SbcCD nuclease subunit
LRIACTADWHLRGKDLTAAREQLAALVRECVEREVSLVCVAGDVFDRPSIGDNDASTGAIAEVGIRAVAELTKHGIEVLMIPGNHDVSGAGSADALHVFDGMPLVNIDRMPSIVDCGNLDIIAIPWSWTGEDPAEVIQGQVQNCRRGLKRLLLAHIQVTGARMNGAFTCEAKPGKWQVSREFLSGLPVSHVALGDFHARQQVSPHGGGYVGALRQLNFGEEGNPAGFEVWDSDTGEVEWVELDAAPKHVTIKVEPGAPAPDVRQFNGSKVRVQYLGGEPDMADVRALEAQGVDVEHMTDLQERIPRAEVPAGVVREPHGLIRLWGENQNPAVDGPRLEAMLRVYDKIIADQPIPTVTDVPAAIDEPEMAETGTDGVPF